MKVKKILGYLVVAIFLVGFQSSESFAKEYTVEMKQDGSKFKYSPNKLTVKLGDKVIFVLVSGTPHTVTFEPKGVPGKSAKEKKELASSLSSKKNYGFLSEVGAKHTVEFKNTPIGEYNYFCIPHKAMGMKGKIIVNK